MDEFFLTQTILPRIADGGAVLNVSSGLARFTGPGYAAYAAAEGAVEVLTRYQGQELGGRGIRVNALLPGAIATDFGGGLVRDNTDVNPAIAQAIALGRVGEPDDIGAAVPAILSDALHWAIGTRIELSGGQSLQIPQPVPSGRSRPSRSATAHLPRLSSPGRRAAGGLCGARRGVGPAAPAGRGLAGPVPGSQVGRLMRAAGSARRPRGPVECRAYRPARRASRAARRMGWQ